VPRRRARLCARRRACSSPAKLAFVYQGAGRKQAKGADVTLRLCKDEACDIQWCLARNNNSEARCAAVIDAWARCCEAARASERAAPAPPPSPPPPPRATL